MKKVAVIPYDTFAELYRALGHVMDEVKIVDEFPQVAAEESVSIALPGAPSDAPFLAIKAVAELAKSAIDKVPQFAVDDMALKAMEAFKPIHELNCANIKAIVAFAEALRR